jgi:hypothetical protein
MFESSIKKWLEIGVEIGMEIGVKSGMEIGSNLNVFTIGEVPDPSGR